MRRTVWGIRWLVGIAGALASCDSDLVAELITDAGTPAQDGSHPVDATAPVDGTLDAVIGLDGNAETSTDAGLEAAPTDALLDAPSDVLDESTDAPVDAALDADGGLPPCDVTEYATGIPNDDYVQAMATGPDGKIWFVSSGERVGWIQPPVTDGGPTQIALFDTGLFSFSIAPGPDGHMWLGGEIGVTPVYEDGGVGAFVGGGYDFGLTRAPGSELWFTEAISTGAIGRLSFDPGDASTFTTTIVPYVGALDPIAAGSSGDVWFARKIDGGSFIGRAGTLGDGGINVTEFPEPESQPRTFAYGPDGRMWFTLVPLQTKLMRIVADSDAGVVGTLDELAIPSGRYAADIVRGADGAMWFTAAGGGTASLGRVTAAGVFSQCAVTSLASGMTIGADGRVWYSARTSIGVVNSMVH